MWHLMITASASYCIRSKEEFMTISYVTILATYIQTVNYVHNFVNTGGSLNFQIKVNLQKQTAKNTLMITTDEITRNTQ